MQEENAAETLAQIADGRTAPCLLPLIPLMQRGAEIGIIAALERIGAGGTGCPATALVFADLTDCRPVWKQALEGWNVEQSAQVLEWQAEAEKRGLARGKAEAKMDALLRVLRTRFPTAVPEDLERVVRETTDLNQLDRWLEAAVKAATLAAFRRRAGVAVPNGGRRSTRTAKRSGTRRKR